MKLDKDTLSEKKFYVTRKQLDDLHDKMRGLPYRKLEEPYQDGWKFTLVLRDDIARSAKAPVIQNLLERFCNVAHCKNPKHVSLIRKTPTIDQLHKLIINRHVGSYKLCIRHISEKEFKELPVTHQKYFELVSNFVSKYEYGGRIMYQSNIPNFYFTVKTHKRMITQVQDIDPIMKKEEARLKKILEPYWRTLGYGEGYYHYFENRKERRKSKVELTKIDLTE